MKYCKNCNVLINNEKETCFLCNNEVENSNKEYNVQDYPKYSSVNENMLLPLIFAIISSIFGVIAIILNLLLYDKFSFAWSLGVCFSSFMIWVALRLVIFSHKNLTLRLTLAHITVFWLLIFIDLAFSSVNVKYWSITYASPIISAIFLTSTLIIVFTRKNSYPDYFGNLLLNVLFLITPLILCFSVGVVNTLIPSTISAVLGILTLLLMFVLPSNKTREEIKKRLHI